MTLYLERINWVFNNPSLPSTIIIGCTFNPNVNQRWRYIQQGKGGRRGGNNRNILARDYDPPVSWLGDKTSITLPLGTWSQFSHDVCINIILLLLYYGQIKINYKALTTPGTGSHYKSKARVPTYTEHNAYLIINLACLSLPHVF